MTSALRSWPTANDATTLLDLGQLFSTDIKRIPRVTTSAMIQVALRTFQPGQGWKNIGLKVLATNTANAAMIISTTLANWKITIETRIPTLALPRSLLVISLLFHAYGWHIYKSLCQFRDEPRRLEEARLTVKVKKGKTSELKRKVEKRETWTNRYTHTSKPSSRTRNAIGGFQDSVHTLDLILLSIEHCPSPWELWIPLFYSNTEPSVLVSKSPPPGETMTQPTWTKIVSVDFLESHFPTR